MRRSPAGCRSGASTHPLNSVGWALRTASSPAVSPSCARKASGGRCSSRPIRQPVALTRQSGSTEAAAMRWCYFRLRVWSSCDVNFLRGETPDHLPARHKLSRPYGSRRCRRRGRARWPAPLWRRPRRLRRVRAARGREKSAVRRGAPSAALLTADRRNTAENTARTDIGRIEPSALRSLRAANPL